MKVIDLLNKIANGEEVPKKIKYKSFILERTKSSEVKRLYVDEQGMFFPECYSFDLNDEVEIIEEDKKIEKLNIYNYTEHDIMTKINEIIDYLEENK